MELNGTFLREVLQGLADPVIVKDADLKWVLGNSGFSRLVGCPQNELAGKTDADFFSGEEADEFARLDRTVLSSGRLVEKEVSIHDSMGAPHWFSFRTNRVAHPETKEHYLVCIIHSLDDVKRQEEGLQRACERLERWVATRTTQLKEREELYRTIFEQSPVGISHFDADGVIIDVNDVLCDITGSDREALIGFDQLGEIRDKQMLRMLRRVIKGGEGFFEGEYVSVTGGRRAVLRARGRSLKSGNGQLLGGVSIVVDISGEKELENNLRRAKDEAEAASLAKSRFLANMSHEIRTPISGIIGMAEVLRATGVRPEQKRYLSMVLESSRSLLDIVNDLLDISRIEAHEMHLQVSDFDLAATVEKVAHTFEVEARNRGLALDVEIDPKAMTTVRGDSGRLGQVLRNLVSNAIKFTEKGRVRIRVVPLDPVIPDEQEQQEETTGAGQRFLFSVLDTGTGIPPGQEERLFASFSQLDDSYSKRHRGTGLGLAICKQLVDMMGGSIGYTGAPGEGTEFYFSVCFEEALRKKSAEDVTVPSTSLAELPPLRILLAEDNTVNKLFITHFMQEAGHQVTAVGNGREALEAVLEMQHSPEGDFHLVIMDVQMPEMDGVEATKAIRREGLDIPVIALTAYAMAGDEERFLAAGMNAYVSKPVDTEVLYRAIAGILISQQ